MKIIFYLLFILLLVKRVKQVLSLKKLLNTTERKLRIKQYNTNHNKLGSFIYIILMSFLLIATYQLAAFIFKDVHFILLSILVLLLFFNKLSEKYYCVNVFQGYITYGLKIITFDSIYRYSIDLQAYSESYLLSIFVNKRRKIIDVYLSKEEKIHVDALLSEIR